MLPFTCKPGNIIKIPIGHIRENNWPGSLDNTTYEKLIASNMTAIVQIYSSKNKLIDTWQTQAFGFQENYNVCINTNMDVMSGFFSGCWMASYRKDGHRRVAHIYTSGVGGKAKEQFIKELYNRGIVLSCFKPSWKQPATQCLGIITSNDTCYSLGVTQTGIQYEFKINYIEKAIPQKSAII